MTLARGAVLGMLGAALACLDATDTCACTPPLQWGIVYGSVSRAGSPVNAAQVEVEVFQQGCDGGQPAYGWVEELAPTDGEGRYRARVTAPSAVDAACVRVTAHAAAGVGTATGGPLHLGGSDPLDSVRVDVIIP
jgi:hypothetical protein